MQAVLNWLGGLPPAVVYPVAALLIFAETGLVLGLVVPGELTLLFVGFLASTATLRLPVAVVVMALAALAGDALAFHEGRRVGPHLRASRFGRSIGDRRWRRAEEMVTRHGGRAVGAARFVAFARTLTPRLAGMTDMPFWRVLPWDVLGVVIWVGGSVTLGYLAGSSYTRVAAVFGRATKGLVLLGLIIAALVWLGRYFGRHQDPVTAFGSRLTQTWPLHRLHRFYIDGFGWLMARLGAGGAVAANLFFGVIGLLGIGFALTWLVDRLISGTGIPLIDAFIADWFTGQRTPAVTHAAQIILDVLRGSFLVAAVAVTGLALNPRPRSWRTDLLGVLGTAGAFIPLLTLALAADWARSGRQGWSLFADPALVVTASLGVLAWLLGRRLPWAAAVVVWFLALGGILLTAGASLYLGRAWPSEVVASVLLGSLWVLVFIVAWRARDRVRATDPALESPDELVGAAARAGRR